MERSADPQQRPGPTEPGGDAAAPDNVPPAPRESRTGIVVAWLVIVAVVAFAITLQYLPLDPEAEEATEQIGLILMRMQAQYIVGVHDLLGNSGQIYTQAKPLDTGTLGQRQRFVVLAAEIAGPAEAGQRLKRLDGEIDRERARSGSDFRPTATQLEAESVLRKLYLDENGGPVGDDPAAERARIDALDADSRRLLTSELGWFGELALTPDGASDRVERQRLLQGPRRVMIALALALGLLAAACLAGLVAWILVVIRAVRGEFRLAFRLDGGGHGVYAETFAIWIATFFALQLLAALAAAWLPGNELFAAMVAFALSLTALGWPRLRGVPWARTRREIGLVGGGAPAREPLFGLVGYLMAIPLLGVGVVLTLLLMALQGLLAPPLEPFAPATGPAHPVVLEIAEPGWWIKLQVLLLASVVAPIIEETMFRGVLYRHLRGATARFGRASSVLLSGGLNALVFASVHPQGWVAIPALMSLASSFVWLREWRGTLLPSMIAHGVSNGLVMLVLFLVLGA